MAKKKSQKPAKKALKKPVTAKKAAPGKSVPAKKAAKKTAKAKPAAPEKAARKPLPPAKKTASPAKKVNKPAKSIAVPAKSKAVAPVKQPVKKEEVKVKPTASTKTIPAKDTKPATAPVALVDKKAKKAIPAPAPLPPPPSNLPKLPKGFVLKKQKGKLAPGEKRVFKTNVITHHVISDIVIDENEKKRKPEPKGKFVMEYLLHTPVSLLYDFLTTPNGLAEWFADGVDLKNDIYTFDWDGQKQNAQVISAKIDSFIRLRWMDKPEGSYFEFLLNQDELTNEISLMVTDFGESEDDIRTSRQLWESQIHRLIKALGSY